MAGYFSQLESLYSALDIEDNDEDDDFFNIVVAEMESEDLVRVFKCDSCGKTLKTERGFKSHKEQQTDNNTDDISTQCMIGAESGMIL